MKVFMEVVRFSLYLILVILLIASCQTEEDNSHEIDPVPKRTFLDPNTIVRTSEGEMKVSDLKVGDLVLTPNGFRKVTEIIKSNSKLTKYIVRDRVLSLGKEIWLAETVEICQAVVRRISKHVETLEWVSVGSIDERAVVLIFSEKNRGRKEKVSDQLELPFYCSLGLLNATKSVKTSETLCIKLEDDSPFFANDLLVR